MCVKQKNLFIKMQLLLKNIPSSDPIVYCVHRFLLGHKKMEQDFNATKKDIKFEDSIEYKNSIYTRNMMQYCALFGAAGSFSLGYFSPILHTIFHSFNLSYYSCLSACLLTGHIIGMAIGLAVACCTKQPNQVAIP